MDVSIFSIFHITHFPSGTLDTVRRGILRKCPPKLGKFRICQELGITHQELGKTRKELATHLVDIGNNVKSGSTLPTQLFVVSSQLGVSTNCPRLYLAYLYIKWNKVSDSQPKCVVIVANHFRIGAASLT